MVVNTVKSARRLLRDSAAARWTALVLLALMMFFAYMFVDVLSPLKSMLATQMGWDSATFGIYGSSEFFLNVFVLFLIIAGIILDKMGIRFTVVLSGAMMVVGALIKYYALSDAFASSSLAHWLNSWWVTLPASAKLASLGFMIFGSGCEMAGITVSKAIVKWFTGKEMALAMGVEMAIARLGVALVMVTSPRLAKHFTDMGVRAPVLLVLALLCVGFICFIAYAFLDYKLDKQTGESGVEPEDPFRFRDLGKLITNRPFLIIALLCVLYYSAIFPFQKYAVNMLQCNITFNPPAEGSFWASSTVAYVQYVVMLIIAITAFTSNFSRGVMKSILLVASIASLLVFCYMAYCRQSAESIFAVFPLLAVGITPILGKYVDNKGKAASMLMLGSILLIICHLTFAFVLPQFKGSPVGGVVLAFATILVLGSSFSLVPASLWPSVPKLVDSKVIGSAYALIFWIQNIGLWLFPLLIGKVLKASNPEVEQALASGELTPTEAAVSYNYTNALLMLAMLGVAALVLGILLKAVDKKHHLGLEEPNIKPQ